MNVLIGIISGIAGITLGLLVDKLLIKPIAKQIDDEAIIELIDEMGLNYETID